MQTFASKHKTPTQIFRKISAPSYCHGRDSQRAFVRRILRSVDAQAKLTIGAPDDIYEQEADRVANAVMRMPDESLYRHPLEEADELLKTKDVVDESPDVMTTGMASVIASVRGGGQPLQTSERTFFESRFPGGRTSLGVGPQ
jgi:hypothetical protein